MNRPLFLAAAWCVLCACGPGWTLSRGHSEPAPLRDPPSDAPSAPGPVLVESVVALPALTRCERACRHIAGLTGDSSGADERRLWLEGCAARCEREASPGRLDCYERSTSVSDLNFCMTP